MLQDSGLKEINLFYKAIYGFNKMAANSYKSIIESDNNNIIYALHIVRLLIDGICSMYGVKLANNPELYIEKFNADERMDSLRIDGKKLTTGLIIRYLDERFLGIKELYEESCNYLHPTIFFKYFDKSNSILTPKNKWHIKGEKGNRFKLEYIVDAISSIHYDIQMEVYNEILVSLHPDKLKEVKWKRKAKPLDKESCIKYIEESIRREEKYLKRQQLRDKDKEEANWGMG